MRGGVLQREIVLVSLSAVEGSSGTRVQTPAHNKHVVTDSRRVRSLTAVRVGVSVPEIDPIYTKGNVSRVKAVIPSQSRAYILRRIRHVAVRVQQLVTTLSQSVLCNVRQAVLVPLTDQLNITGAALPNMSALDGLHVAVDKCTTHALMYVHRGHALIGLRLVQLICHVDQGANVQPLDPSYTTDGALLRDPVQESLFNVTVTWYTMRVAVPVPLHVMILTLSAHSGVKIGVSALETCQSYIMGNV